MPIAVRLSMTALAVRPIALATASSVSVPNLAISWDAHALPPPVKPEKARIRERESLPSDRVQRAPPPLFESDRRNVGSENCPVLLQNMFPVPPRTLAGYSSHARVRILSFSFGSHARRRPVPTDHNPTADFPPQGDAPRFANGETGSLDTPIPSTVPPAAAPAPTLSDADPDATTGHTREPTSIATSPEIPAGRYELGTEIARGGMGAVYRATDTAFGREVAVKVLLDRFGVGSGAARRFADEARITGQLQHPAIPPVHDLGTLTDGRPFLTMKLIKGDTLHDLLRARPNPSAERGRFVAVFEQVCQALAYAHAHGVIHRDLKPQNVMVGSYGEVQVMDWGLAKVLGTRRGPDESEDTGTAIQSLRASDSAFTQAGSVLGTPAFMPPEQAIGAINKIDARSDVFGLGAILAVILTGKPPFVGTSVETTRLQAALGNVEECFARLEASGAEPELVALCKRCLSKRPDDRPKDADEVALSVAQLRAAADERARQAELDRVKAEGEKVAAELQAVEQRKRRWVQLVLAVVVSVALAGAGVATALVIEQRAQDKLSAEQKQSEERVAAEQKRQDDLRAADEKARAEQLAVQRRARAEGLVQSLKTADTTGVPRIVSDLADLRALVHPKLVALAAEPVESKTGLHARLALLTDEPARASELAAYLPTCKREELLTIRDALRPYAEGVAPRLWVVLTDSMSDGGKRMRAACALAAFTPTDERWVEVVATVTDMAVQATPAEFVVWAVALEPVRGFLVPRLLRRYLAARADIRGGKLGESALAAAVSGYNLTADLLAQYTTDRPADLAELAMVADPRHCKLFASAIEKNKVAVISLLEQELAKKPPENLQVAELDATLETHSKRQGHAAAALMALGAGEAAWPVFVFPKDGDPTARSYLLARLEAIGADPLALMRRFDAEADVSAKRALVVALGDYPFEAVPGAEREAMTAKLLVLYREHSDPGLHGAIDWLLRQKWGKAKELTVVDAQLATASRAKVLARELMGVGPVSVGPLLPAPVVAEKLDWFVNGECQTFAVIRGPVEFTMGAPASEPGWVEVNEPAHRKRISRMFAVATKEVTNAEFLRFLPKHEWVRRYSPGADTPAVGMSWYDCAGYCNWLSEREGIPADQWCYEPNKAGLYGDGMRIKPGHLKLTGYRLPTEAEWEYACRGSAVTVRYHGRGEELLPRYGWFLPNAEDREWPVGRLRPNEWGLFDTLGNAAEWNEDPGQRYATGQMEDIENSLFLLIDERKSRILRGGSFNLPPALVRSANRNDGRPGFRIYGFGFRLARTLP
jgi:formylglycine-generating enzyme required for sulfatase activity/tRNA A-37 threonylcarbamoyl transferase component Bud32